MGTKLTRRDVIIGSTTVAVGSSLVSFGQELRATRQRCSLAGWLRTES